MARDVFPQASLIMIIAIKYHDCVITIYHDVMPLVLHICVANLICKNQTLHIFIHGVIIVGPVTLLYVKTSNLKQL